MFDGSDASLFYALLRFEEASLALRAALKLRIVDVIGNDERSLDELQQEFGFTVQAARTYFSLLVAMRLLNVRGNGYSVTESARQALAVDVSTSRAPYLSMGMADEVSELISILQGGSVGLPLYGEEGGGETLMDHDEVASAIAHGLSSRARNFATPLANSIAQVANEARSLADIGAGSHYVADACLRALPQLEQATLVDRPNGMRFARKLAAEQGVDTSRLSFCERDFFVSVPVADIYCISNTAHDWRREDYLRLINNVRSAIPGQGVVCIHEPLLLLDWATERQWLEALWMACYALTLFKLTDGQGSCYSIDEHDAIHAESGFERMSEPVRTADGCTALYYRPIVS